MGHPIAATDRFLGREVHEWSYRFTDEDGDLEEGRMWYDPELHYALRIEDADGTTMETISLDVGHQPSHLFEVPDSYEKVDLGY